eukprot:SAG31_NODE_3439_length_4270_cov_5.065452_4_plen_183_part_00
MEKLHLVSLPSKVGPLLKESDHMKQWRSRHLKVEHGRLQYWENIEHANGQRLPKGQLQLAGAQVLELPPPDGTHRFVFAVSETPSGARAGSGGGPQYILCASTESDKASWLKAVRDSTQPRSTLGNIEALAGRMKSMRQAEADADSATATLFTRAVTSKESRLKSARQTTADMREKYGARSR